MNQPDLEQRLQALQDEVTALRAETRRRRSFTWFAVIGALLAAGAWAQTLTTFNPDEPALAATVNGNFATIKSWLEGKVGLVTATGIQTTTINASGNVTTGPLTATTLNVTGGLLTVGAETIATVANSAGENITTLGSSTRRLCFLTGMLLHDTMANESTGQCFVELVNNTWQLRSNALNGSGDPDVECRARCITW